MENILVNTATTVAALTALKTTLEANIDAALAANKLALAEGLVTTVSSADAFSAQSVAPKVTVTDPSQGRITLHAVDEALRLWSLHTGETRELYSSDAAALGRLLASPTTLPTKDISATIQFGRPY